MPPIAGDTPIYSRKTLVAAIRKFPWKECGSVGRYLKRRYS